MTNNNEVNLKYRVFHRDAALHWNNLANQRQFEFIKQLLTIGALILTVSATIITSFKIINFYSQLLQSYSLLLSWIFILISIFCGLKQLNVDASYFIYLSNDESTRESKFASQPFEQALSDVSRMKPTVPRGDEKWLLSQQTFFVLGIVFITVSATLILALKN